MGGSFDVVGVDVGPKEKSETSESKTYKVTAQLCDDRRTAFVQGEIVGVCVKPDQNGINDGVLMSSIDSFLWKRDDDGNGSNVITQTAVESLDGSVHPLSEVTTVSGQELRVDSVLYAMFYQSNGIVTGS